MKSMKSMRAYDKLNQVIVESLAAEMIRSSIAPHSGCSFPLELVDQAEELCDSYRAYLSEWVLGGKRPK